MSCLAITLLVTPCTHAQAESMRAATCSCHRAPSPPDMTGPEWMPILISTGCPRGVTQLAAASRRARARDSILRAWSGS
jgi:hypothetical protein